jgi:hypothetical protein
VFCCFSVTPGLSIVSSALQASLQKERPKNWREDLRQQTKNGAELHRILLSLARGEAWQATLPGGMVSAPILPSADVRLRAAMFLEEQLFGKAVAQTEVTRAEQEAKELESIRALTDDELAAEATRILEARRVPALTPGPATIAEYVVSGGVPTPEPLGLTARVWNARVTEDQEE